MRTRPGFCIRWAFTTWNMSTMLSLLQRSMVVAMAQNIPDLLTVSLQGRKEFIWGMASHEWWQLLTCNGPLWVCCQSHTAPCTPPLPRQWWSVDWNTCHEKSSYVFGTESHNGCCPTTGVCQKKQLLNRIHEEHDLVYLVNNRYISLYKTIVFIRHKKHDWEFTTGHC